MSIKVCAHEPKYSEAVNDFNERMLAGGSTWGFYVDPVPAWIPRKESVSTWREFYIAVEDDEIVRGGYGLKPQNWNINGKTVQVADWQGPFTEADIDPKYGLLMLRLARSAEKTYSHLFSLGHSDKDANMLRKLGWETTTMPLCLYVARPFRFFRLNNYLRTSKLKRLVSDVLAFSFLGSVLVHLWNGISRLVLARSLASAEVEVVKEFGSWTDELWQQAKGAYACCAVRDSETMNVLSPTTGWPGGTKLKITDRTGQVLGWSIVLVKQMDNDDRFGSLKVGQIADCFGEPEHAAEVLRETHDYLKKQKVDLICLNFSHPAWLGGLHKLGYFVLAGRRIFAFSSALRTELEPLEATLANTHLTNMDGHGPHGFTADQA